MDVGGGLGADLEACVLGLDGAVLDMDVGGGAVVFRLAAGFDDDSIVAADDVAVFDLDVAGVVGIDSVAVGDVKEVAYFDVVD